MYLVARYVPEFGYSFPYQLYLAAGISVMGVVIDLVAVGRFFRSGTTVSPLSPEKSSKLVTQGLYRFTRNPMYLGLVFILSGYCIWLGNLAAFCVIPIFVWYVTRYQIIPEEEVLLETFGEQYSDYCNRVGRWL